MTVYEFLSWATDDMAMVEIFDLNDETGEILSMRDAECMYGEYEVMSFDSYITGNRLCLNIEK